MEHELRRLQDVQTEILNVIDAICRKNDIRYSLYAGTLLGAVRHKGFIPWDDDLDICMGRKDYDRFIDIWNANPPQGYILQNKENTPSFTQSFVKIRKDHTTFLQYEWERGRYHTGIFVDIFPIDRMPSGVFPRMLFLWHCLYYQLLTREFIPPTGTPLERLIASIILSSTPRKKREKIRKKLLKAITAYEEKNLNTVAIETFTTIRMPLPADLLNDYVEVPFEKGAYMCFGHWDEYLKDKFGDYMTPPPEKERVWRHHPLVLDFERNVEEIGNTD